jgi:hypothetical protein
MIGPRSFASCALDRSSDGSRSPRASAWPSEPASNRLAVKPPTLLAATSVWLVNTHFEDLFGTCRCLDQTVPCLHD